jgi:hypothetical protein
MAFLMGLLIQWKLMEQAEARSLPVPLILTSEWVHEIQMNGEEGQGYV